MAPPRFVAPSVIPAGLPIRSTSAEPAGTGSPAESDVRSGGGQPDGISGGVGTNLGELSLPAISATAPNVVPPRLLVGPEPEYPEGPRRLREQGLVVLQAFIGTDGRVENIVLLRGAFPALDGAAIRAISRWRYSPATLNGRAVRVYLSVTVRFALH